MNAHSLAATGLIYLAAAFGSTARADTLFDAFQSACGERFEWADAPERFQAAGWSTAAEGTNVALDTMLDNWSVLLRSFERADVDAFVRVSASDTAIFLIVTRFETRNGVARGCGIYDFAAEDLPQANLISDWIGQQPRRLGDSTFVWFEWPAPPLETRPVTVRATLSAGEPPAAPGATLIVEWVEPLQDPSQ